MLINWTDSIFTILLRTVLIILPCIATYDIVLFSYYIFRIAADKITMNDPLKDEDKVNPHPSYQEIGLVMHRLFFVNIFVFAMVAIIVIHFS